MNSGHFERLIVKTVAENSQFPSSVFVGYTEDKIGNLAFDIWEISAERMHGCSSRNKFERSNGRFDNRYGDFRRNGAYRRGDIVFFTAKPRGFMLVVGSRDIKIIKGFGPSDRDAVAVFIGYLKLKIGYIGLIIVIESACNVRPAVGVFDNCDPVGNKFNRRYRKFFYRYGNFGRRSEIRNRKEVVFSLFPRFFTLSGNIKGERIFAGIAYERQNFGSSVFIGNLET